MEKTNLKKDIETIDIAITEIESLRAQLKEVSEERDGWMNTATLLRQTDRIIIENERLTAKPAAANDRVKALEEDLRMKTAAAIAHRACCGSEHDMVNGKIHGYCVVCGVEWPCETARAFINSALRPEQKKEAR